MLPRLEDPNFRAAAKNCGFCRDFCKKENYYNKKGNVHSRQVLIYLGAIQNSDIARNAEKACNGCDYRFSGIKNRFPRIMIILRNYDIKV